MTDKVKTLKILFLQKRPLFPANTGGKIRSLNILKHLAEWHEVTYICNFTDEEKKDHSLEHMRELGVELHAFPWKETSRNSIKFYLELLWNLISSKYPYTVNKDFDRRIAASATSLTNDGSFDLVICDFVQMARNASHITNTPKLLFQHNVESQIYERMADTETNWLKRFFIQTQARRMKKFERLAGAKFDRVIAVSNEDQSTFSKKYGWEHTSVISTAVDTEYFTQQIHQNRMPGRVVFIGSMDWLPNIDGVSHFVERIWPKVKKNIPHATLDIVGRNPSQAIKNIEKRGEIRVTGSVPDVRPYVHSAELAIVPIYSGGGTRLKIFEFMAMGIPIVSTTIGAEGLDINTNEEILIADTDNDFADSITRLMTEPATRRLMATKARKLVESQYSTKTVARQFDGICRKLVKSGASK